LRRFLLPVFLGAFLLFQVQPLIARAILPWFGGTPSVWTTCMLFFQVVLLGGYAYAHFVATRTAPRTQAALQVLLMVVALAGLALMVMRWGAPLIPGPGWKPQGSELPILRILALLCVAVGVPYFALATTSPLLQSWFSRTCPGVSPYRLYTLSNIGSLLALVTYPFLVEPLFALRAQGMIWGGLFACFALAYLYCALRLPSTVQRRDEPEAFAGDDDPPPPWRLRWLWVALPALACTMLLAATNQVCQEVAVIPFLWILPLSLYLLSFIICFDNERWYLRTLFIPLLLVMAPLVFAGLPKNEELDIRLQVSLYCLALFAVCMVCHGELVSLKPSPRHLTAFYLAVSIGGALGGVLVGLIAPVIFPRFWELPLTVVLCWTVGLWALWREESGFSQPVCWAAMAVGTVGLAVAMTPYVSNELIRPDVLMQCRNFYGSLRVVDEPGESPEWHKHILVHGRIIHGHQFTAPDKRRMASSYYAPKSGVGLAILNHPRRLSPVAQQRSLRIGVVGLGTGSLAVYGEAGDTVRFYEINPQVVAIARNPAYFTYLSQCPAQVQIAMGDARISLERELAQGPQGFDILVLDAFSSDAIPAHLLTREAFDVYLQHMRGREGVIAVHVTNRALDLRPVVRELARHFGLQVVRVDVDGDERTTYATDWMLLSRDPSFGQSGPLAEANETEKVKRHVRLWTDDYSSVYPLLK
jgi:hypothetical protein